MAWRDGYRWGVDADRLLTYAQAAARMNISEKAFRNRVARGAIPAHVLIDRERGPGMPPERFVLKSAFLAWFVAPVETDDTAPEEKTA